VPSWRGENEYAGDRFRSSRDDLGHRRGCHGVQGARGATTSDPDCTQVNPQTVTCPIQLAGQNDVKLLVTVEATTTEPAGVAVDAETMFIHR
jgi:hypothetical protein